MQDINEAITSQGLTEADLTHRINVLIKDYKAKVQGISLQGEKAKQSTKDEAAEYKTMILEQIMVLAEEKSMENTPESTPEPTPEPKKDKKSSFFF
jgi:uncharacterized protein YajQ (UPF0234 family)